MTKEKKYAIVELLFYTYVNNTLGTVIQSGKTFYKQETSIKKSSTEGHVNTRPTVKSGITNKCNTPLAKVYLNSYRFFLFHASIYFH
jgi:hypothetical protein